MASEPKSDLARYAFGYSDKKPHWSFWLMMASMFVASVVGIWWQS
jgi:hypothetical protein